MRSFLLLLTVVIAFAAPAGAGSLADDLRSVKLPPGFSISLYTDQTPNARAMALGDDGTVYVGSMAAGKVYAVRDENRDGQADKVLTLAEGLYMPNGVALIKGDLYIAEVHRITRLPAIASHLAAPPKPEPVFAGYPSDRHHGWKYLRVGPDGKLYAPVGAPCNICLSEKEIYASLTRLDPDGSHFEIIAHGIRNSVGFDWHPDTGAMFFTDNGRDELGDDVPPDELNQWSAVGQHFGYPFCHGGTIADPTFGERKPCSAFVPPAWKFPAHVAAIGIRFYRGQAFPAPYRGQLFVAQHGSWNRSVPQGYRVAVVHFENGKPVSDEVFADGWLKADGQVTGRPVDVLELADGSLLISDDIRGAIYRIRYEGAGK